MTAKLYGHLYVAILTSLRGEGKLPGSAGCRFSSTTVHAYQGLYVHLPLLLIQLNISTIYVQHVFCLQYT